MAQTKIVWETPQEITTEQAEIIAKEKDTKAALYRVPVETGTILTLSGKLLSATGKREGKNDVTSLSCEGKIGDRAFIIPLSKFRTRSLREEGKDENTLCRGEFSSDYPLTDIVKWISKGIKVRSVDTDVVRLGRDYVTQIQTFVKA